MYLSHDPCDCFKRYVTMVMYYYGNIITMAKTISISLPYTIPSITNLLYLTAPENKYLTSYTYIMQTQY